jgi:hypothetical protein
MRISAFCTAVLRYVVRGHPPPAVAQVDANRQSLRFPKLASGPLSARIADLDERFEAGGFQAKSARQVRSPRARRVTARHPDYMRCWYELRASTAEPKSRQRVNPGCEAETD